jgi:hypothetical protein
LGLLAHSVGNEICPKLLFSFHGKFSFQSWIRSGKICNFYPIFWECGLETSTVKMRSEASRLPYHCITLINSEFKNTLTSPMAPPHPQRNLSYFYFNFHFNIWIIQASSFVISTVIWKMLQ